VDLSFLLVSGGLGGGLGRGRGVTIKHIEVIDEVEGTIIDSQVFALLFESLSFVLSIDEGVERNERDSSVADFIMGHLVNFQKFGGAGLAEMRKGLDLGSKVGLVVLELEHFDDDV
jgi:hypothetical protein